MILYGNKESGHAYKIKLFLTLTDTPHEYRHVDLSLPRNKRSEDFRRASRFGEVPVLVDDGLSLCQSNAILMYLAEKLGLYQHDRRWYQSIREWLSWEANRLGFSVANYRYSWRFDKQPQAVLDYFKKRTLTDLDTLDSFLSQSDFLTGTQWTIADITCAGYLFFLDQIEIDSKNWPYVDAWLQRIQSLPKWQAPYELMK